MKIIKLITKIIGLLILTSGVNSSFAQQIQVRTTTTFSCKTNAECKRKCEELGSDHTWKPNPGGPTLGTCTKKSQSLVDRKKIGSFPGTHVIFVETETNDNSFEKLQFVLELMKDKKWSKDDVAPPSVPLTIAECEALGGTVQYHSGCSTTLLKCSNRGYAACITKTKLTKK